MNATEILEKIQPIVDLRVHEVSHDRNTALVADGERFVFRPGGHGRVVPVANAGNESLAKFVNLPQGVVDKLLPGTYAKVATELLGRKEDYAVLTKQDEVVDFVKKGQYHNYNPEKVVTTITKAIDGADFNRVLTYPNHAVELEVISVRQEEVQRGDLIRAGALVAFSPIGTIQPMVQSFALRLVCTNGATTRDVMQEYRPGDGDDVWQWWRKAMKAAVRSIAPITNRWRQMMAEGITPEERAQILAALIKKAKLGEIEAKAIQMQALQAPPTNSYEMMNLMTWASSHVSREPVVSRRLRLVAEDYHHEATHARICPVCRRNN